MHNKKSFILINLIMGLLISTIGIMLILNTLKLTYIFYNNSRIFIIESNDFLNTSQRLKYDLYRAFGNINVEKDHLEFSSFKNKQGEIYIRHYSFKKNGKNLVYVVDGATELKISNNVKEIRCNFLDDTRNLFFIDFIYEKNTFRRYYATN